MQQPPNWEELCKVHTAPTMEEVREIRELILAFKRLPEGSRRVALMMCLAVVDPKVGAQVIMQSLGLTDL